jgi:hypothetical protein
MNRRPVSGISTLDKDISRAQLFICPVCSEPLYNGEPIHRHHIIPLFLYSFIPLFLYSFIPLFLSLKEVSTPSGIFAFFTWYVIIKFIMAWVMNIGPPFFA